jgi:thioredoxin-related protein
MFNFVIMKKPAYIFCTIWLVGSLFLANAQEHKGPVKWMSFEEAVEKSKTEKRKIFIDVYTDWCGWCKVMDKNTFTDPEIAKLLNEKFYPVKLDAEQPGDITFRGNTFKFVPYGNKGVHQLAAALLNNQLSYPNFVFLDEEFRLVPIYSGYTSVPGYKKPEEFHVFLSFVSGDFYQKENIQEYQKMYKSPYSAASNSTGGR